MISLGRAVLRNCLHNSATRNAVTQLRMPAMSPTMTEGGIAQWKKKEGEPFSAGDVLLEIETDKATIDVEAQDDGIMGKILTPDGTKNVAVGKVIALLAEEGDDISNLQPPKEDPPPPEEEKASSKTTPKADASTSFSSPAPPSPSAAHKKHSRPLFPSVHRLFAFNNVADLDTIKGTGVRGMLTKGDVLAYLGKASSPTGTYKEPKPENKPLVQKIEESKPLDGAAIRRMIMSGLMQNSIKTRSAVPAPTIVHDFDSVIADYLPSNVSPPQSQPERQSTEEYLGGLF